MSQIDDKKVIDWIKNQDYSNLEFMEECWQSSENKWYLGFYYFIQYLKQESTHDIFDAIVSRSDSKSSAYCYLGDTAKKIFNSFDTDHISASFYRHSIALSQNNADAHWGLYFTSGSVTSYLKSLKLDYENNHFEKLGHKIDNAYLYYNKLSGLSREDWQTIKVLILDERVCCGKEMLIFLHFNLDEVDHCLALIETVENVKFEIIKEYFDRKLISKELALSKLYAWQISDFLGDDHKGIYLECVKESKKGKVNPTRAILIQKAFRAEEYQEVIAYYDEAPSDDVLFSHEIDSRLYYLLALSHLKQKPNKQVLDYVNNKPEYRDGKPNALHQAVRCRLKIETLEQLFSEGNNFDCKIDIIDIYQEAVKILDDQNLLKHFLYERLDCELKSLKDKWNNSCFRKQLTEMKTKLSSGDMDSDDFLRLYNLGIECSEYNYVIESVT